MAEENSGSGVTPIVLKAGQFMMFNERVLHRSGSNQSSRRRPGVAAHYIPSLVRIIDVSDDTILLCNEDTLGFNHLVAPPTPCTCSVWLI